MRQDFMVFGESSGVIQPSESAFNDPALGEYLEGMGFGAFNDLDQPAKHRFSPIKQLAGIAPVDKHGLDAAKRDKQADEHQLGADSILYTSRMNRHSKEQSQGIYGDMSLTALDFLARIESALPPFKVVLTDCESMMATVGWGFLPCRCRSASRSACKTWGQTPAKRQRRKRA
jgi:hypothetical protein